ncbi:hypothetical protein GW17_00024322, partial [Ensete ventricosum]
DWARLGAKSQRTVRVAVGVGGGRRTRTATRGAGGEGGRRRGAAEEERTAGEEEERSYRGGERETDKSCREKKIPRRSALRTEAACRRLREGATVKKERQREGKSVSEEDSVAAIRFPKAGNRLGASDRPNKERFR